jgi:predicted DNA binding CopG/RHH family protein
MKSNKFKDPYDKMADSEFSDYIARLFDDQRGKTSKPVSLRMPSDLLRRVRRMADAGEVPYQQLIKKFIENGTTQLEQRYERAKKAPKARVRH